MWLTGFDAPTVSTLYLDKPQKDHTLRQTIARANRMCSHKVGGVEKKNGEMVDYYGVLAITPSNVLNVSCESRQNRTMKSFGLPLIRWRTCSLILSCWRRVCCPV